MLKKKKEKLKIEKAIFVAETKNDIKYKIKNKIKVK